MKHATPFLFAPHVAWLVSATALFLHLQGCAPGGFGVTAGLETDEAYLQRDEAFVTDAEYLAFAMEQAGVVQKDDYYDADRASTSKRSGRSFTPYSNSLLGISTPYNYGAFGNGWGSAFGGYGSSPFGYNPYGYGAYGNNPYGYNSWGYNPYGYGAYGNNPYGYNSWGYNPYGYNPYGYNPYSGGWGNGGGWIGGNGGWSDGSGINVSSGPRTPILTSTGNNSNHGDTGLLIQPRELEVSNGLVTPNVMSQALGRNMLIDSGETSTNVVESDMPSPGPAANPWQRMLASPSLPDEIRDPSNNPVNTPAWLAPSESSRDSYEPNQPATRPVSPSPRTESRPSSPARPSGSSGGGASRPAPSRNGRGG